MMKIYMIEIKDFTMGDCGIDRMVADLGCLPRVYTNKARAIADAKKSVANYQEKYGYDLVAQSPDYNAIGTDCLYAARLVKSDGFYRHEIRVYEQLTW